MCNVQDAVDTFTKTYLGFHYRKAKIFFCDVLFTSASLNALILIFDLHYELNSFLRPIPSDTLQLKTFLKCLFAMFINIINLYKIKNIIDPPF